MHFIREGSKIVVFLFLLIIAQACSRASMSSIDTYAGKTLFLQNNIHAQIGPRDTKASYANWTDPGLGHIIVPVNTPVEIGKYIRGLTIKNLADGRLIFFEYDARNMGMSAEQYIPLMASSSKIDLSVYSEVDQEGTKNGKALVGMSKEGVKTALGYPAAHQTPSLKNNSWMYWRNRWNTKVIEFDTDGKVKIIRY